MEGHAANPAGFGNSFLGEGSGGRAPCPRDRPATLCEPCRVRGIAPGTLPPSEHLAPEHGKEEDPAQESCFAMTRRASQPLRFRWVFGT